MSNLNKATKYEIFLPNQYMPEILIILKYLKPWLGITVVKSSLSNHCYKFKSI